MGRYARINMGKVEGRLLKKEERSHILEDLGEEVKQRLCTDILTFNSWFSHMVL